VTEVDFDHHRHGVHLALKTGHQFYFLISWSQGAAMAHSLQTMLTSPVGNTLKLKPRDLDRLIKFITGL
jgi:hypothetical protein